MKKILVTGGSGLVGSYLQQELSEAIYISSKDFDLTNQKDVENVFSTHKPDTVIHLAAKVGGLIDNQEHPVAYLDDNLLMNTLMLKYAHKYGVSRFTAILSSCAFPEISSVYPMKEEVMHTGTLDENTLSYGLSKRVMAVQIENYNKEFCTKYNYITPCNIYGVSNKVSEGKSHFVTALINKINSANHNGDETITLFGDGTPIRQLMYAKDLAEIIKIMIEKDITDSFNIATDETLTIDAIARIALKATNSEHLKIAYDSGKPNGQQRKDLAIEKFKKILPDYKCTPLLEGFKMYYEAVKNK